MKISKPATGPFKNPKDVRYIIVHCSATPADRDIGVEEITRYHRQRGFITVGYHFIVRLDGTIELGRPLEMVGAHCLGKNKCSIGICYVGGIDSSGQPSDTRTAQQKESLNLLITQLQEIYPRARVKGHRDFARKACPSFDASSEYGGTALAGILAMAMLMSGCATQKRHTTESVNLESSHNVRHIAVLGEEAHTADSVEMTIDAPQICISTNDSVRVQLRAEAIRLVRTKKTENSSTYDSTESADAKLSVDTELKATEQRKPRIVSGFGVGWTIFFAILLLPFIQPLVRLIRKFLPSRQ